MIVSEIIVEGTSRAFKGTKRGVSLKYRCTYGPRKGQVRASPAACNAPININARNTLKKTQRARGSMMTKKASITKRTGATSKRVQSLNKPRRRTSRRRIK